MKNIWTSMHLVLLFALCVALCLMVIKNRALKRHLRLSEAKVRKCESEIGSFAASMAAKQLQIGRATFLMCGPEQINPAPVFGQPVCQFGCITTEPQIWFMKAYVNVLEQHQKQTDLEQPAVQTQVVTRVAPPKSNAIICHLKTRDKLITIQTGQNGPLYTVKSSDGQILAADLPAAELSAKYPELKEVAERGIADWADMDLRDHNIVMPLDTAPVETFRVETITIEHNNSTEDIRR